MPNRSASILSRAMILWKCQSVSPQTSVNMTQSPSHVGTHAGGLCNALVFNIFGLDKPPASVHSYPLSLPLYINAEAPVNYPTAHTHWVTHTCSHLIIAMLIAACFLTQDHHAVVNTVIMSLIHTCMHIHRQ